MGSARHAIVDWSAEHGFLIELYDKGLSYPQIAARMGVTSASVGSRIWRLAREGKLKLRNSPENAGAKRSYLKVVRRGIGHTVRSTPKGTQRIKGFECRPIEQVPGSEPVGFFDLQDGMCRALIGKHDKAPPVHEQRYCGCAVVPGSTFSFCEFHAASFVTDESADVEDEQNT